ncbi:MAG: NBR1-Ig-like domain-containing protein [Candidatus Promineifilaceae bacterium]
MIRENRIFKWLLVFFFLVSCTPPPVVEETADTPTPSLPVAGLAQVTALDIRQLETFPIQIQVVVEGILPDSCTTIERIENNREGGRFQITIHTLRAAGVACLDAEQPFTETIDLDVLNLEAGIYTVQVNGIGGTFALQNDNVPDQSNAVISGLVWHDLCTISGGEGGGPVTASFDCVTRADGSYIADGQLKAGEPGLGGVMVNLGAGPCPAVGLGTTITDEDGVYLFSGLLGGTYCVSIDTTNAANASLLIPGQWTNTADSATGEMTVTVDPAQNKADVNFGWDYQFLPAPENVVGDCVDDMDFTADISIPDDTVIEAGETFTKTWELLNTGTCTWGTDYSLVFVTGDQMGGPDIQPLDQVVEPGETIELSVILVAPEEPGDYRSEWKLRNANGVLFGVGVEAGDPFWVQIVVE